MGLNIEVLREMVDWAEAQRKLPLRQKMWMQAEWAIDLMHPSRADARRRRPETECKTAMCLAGHVVLKKAHETPSRYRIKTTINGSLKLTLRRTGAYASWDAEALKLLGLIDRNGNRLPGANTMSQLFMNDRAGIRQVRVAARKVAELYGMTL